MKRTKQNNQEKQQLGLEAFESESFLSINRKLLGHFEPNLTVYIGNLTDNRNNIREEQTYNKRKEEQ